MVKHPFLEVTYRKGKPFASYLYLKDSPPGERCCGTREVCPGGLVDIGSDGEVVGIEFLSPGRVTADDLRAIDAYLQGLGIPSEDLSPIMAH